MRACVPGAVGLLALSLLAGIAAFLPAGPGAWAATPPRQPQAPARAAEREAVVQNATDMPLRELYLRPEGAAERGADRLGNEMLGPDASTRLRLGRGRECVFDVTAVFADDSQEKRARQDLCRNPRLVFGDPAVPKRSLLIENRSGQALRELYALPAGRQRDQNGTQSGSQSGSQNWGVDRLGEEPVGDGETFRLTLRVPDCRVDLRAVYEDDEAEEKRGVDACSVRNLVFDGSGVPHPPEIPLSFLNRHDAPVAELYISGTDKDEWGPDRLETPLERGGRRRLDIAVDCTADMRIVFPNGAAEERREVDLCAETLIVFRPGWTVAARLDAGLAEPPPPRPGSLRLRNAARVPVVQFYVDAPRKEDAAGEPERGPDRLGRNVLGVGETLDLAPPEPGACAARLLAVLRDGTEIRRDAIDLCSGQELALR
ncbi:hypothetical protein [Roseomonas mucosa]